MKIAGNLDGRPRGVSRKESGESSVIPFKRASEESLACPDLPLKNLVSIKDAVFDDDIIDFADGFQCSAPGIGNG